MAFRSVAALVLLGSLGTVGGRAGYSVVKVQFERGFHLFGSEEGVKSTLAQKLF